MQGGKFRCGGEDMRQFGKARTPAPSGDKGSQPVRIWIAAQGSAVQTEHRAADGPGIIC